MYRVKRNGKDAVACEPALPPRKRWGRGARTPGRRRRCRRRPSSGSPVGPADRAVPGPPSTGSARTRTLRGSTVHRPSSSAAPSPHRRDAYTGGVSVRRPGAVVGDPQGAARRRRHADRGRSPPGVPHRVRHDMQGDGSRGREPDGSSGVRAAGHPLAGRGVQAPPIGSVTVPVPPQVRHSRPSTCPLPLHSGQMFSPLPSSVSSASTAVTSVRRSRRCPGHRRYTSSRGRTGRPYAATRRVP